MQAAVWHWPQASDGRSHSGAVGSEQQWGCPHFLWRYSACAAASLGTTETIDVGTTETIDVGTAQSWSKEQHSAPALPSQALIFFWLGVHGPCCVPHRAQAKIPTLPSPTSMQIGLQKFSLLIRSCNFNCSLISAHRL